MTRRCGGPARWTSCPTTTTRMTPSGDRAGDRASRRRRRHPRRRHPALQQAHPRTSHQWEQRTGETIMNNQGKLTGGTNFLLLASIVAAIVGGAMAPDNPVYTWLLIGAFVACFTALNNVYLSVRTKVREAEIRQDERTKLASGAIRLRPRNDGQR